MRKYRGYRSIVTILLLEHNDFVDDVSHITEGVQLHLYVF